MQEYKNKRCLVTGGTGLVGRQVVNLLTESGALVRVISLDKLNLSLGATYFQVDLRDFELCKKYTKNIDYVFHIAGIKASPKITLEKPSTMSIPALQINTNVLEACRVNQVKNVLFTSSIGAYSEAEFLQEKNAYEGKPMDFFPGMVKRMAEFQIQSIYKEFGFPYKIARLTNVYGIGDNFNPDNAMFIPSLMAKVLRGDNPVEIWGDGSQIRDFVYSKDVALGILQSMLYAPCCIPINLGGGQSYSVYKVLMTLMSIVPFSIKFNKDMPSGVSKRVMDISEAQKYGYNPTTELYKGLKETWEWFKENKDEYLKRWNYFDTK